MDTQKKALQIHAADSVAVALEPLTKGSKYYGVTLINDIPQGHKFALKTIQKGEKVIKYGYPIGQAISDIQCGEHVHVHNMKTLLSEHAEYRYEPVVAKHSDSSQQPLPDLLAYKRPDGRIGIRNEVWIVPTVGCVNKLATLLAEKANALYSGLVDGVFAWTHPYGCSQMGVDHEKTRTILADLVKHPNAGAVLVLGLGCENNTIAKFKELVGEMPEGRVSYLVAQDCKDEIADGLAAIEKLAHYASTFKREKVPAENLVLGMKCGGSDGLSGVTANALIGQICDKFTPGGCKVMLTEVPEMFGAEQLLMNRCTSREIFDKTVSLITNFKDYFVRHNQTVYENPSPGNKAGGITTLEDKSLGCVQKGGTSPIVGVLQYGDRIETADSVNGKCAGGVYLLEGPGNDIVSTTAMTAAGAHIILFTTGRGTPLGAPVPTLKIASNHPLAEKKNNWIDFDASGILVDSSQTLINLQKLIIDTASGRNQTRNEKNGYREIAIFKEGVTL